MANIEPRWLIEARKHIGLTEIKGAKHNPEIVQFWRDIKRGGIKDDETPWCAAFVGAMLERVGIRSTRFESAKSYLDWGEKLDTPVYGCIVVFTRVGGGHVGFVVGRRANGDLLVLGGNQGDAVNIRAFPTSRVSGYRWPAGEPRNTALLPVGDAATSTNEA
ncbi:TPA: TIGR02594 family protein [Escherichia coli]|uniref:TIGR02594 family protein n=1 Tax=Escherichia coli TaxID=562 RepID=UPI00083D8D70|nr:TIGR02594 family protein [Escherichia coli]EMB9116631.1 TIGR02594 family protein [Escherichia coli]ODH15024.1 TIGR02594 family protein [Escherichia coli]ODH38516.1 TIGR02594 family protein [Escherichia coli]HAH6603563.1 TIGR02594 family protein [Escherichia coli]HBP4487235.1 TIGR02594 family protein [Escherichia coli]